MPHLLTTDTPGAPGGATDPERSVILRWGLHLFIVSRQQPWLFGYLLNRFAEDPGVTVIVDRRIAERRQAQRPIETERRRSQRHVRLVADHGDLMMQGCVIVDL